MIFGQKYCLVQGPAISMRSAARVNLFVAEQYRDNLGGGSQLIEMLSVGVE